MIATPRSEFRALRVYCTLLASCLLMGLAGPAIHTVSGQPPTHVLADGNSYINIDTTTNVQATVYDWFVEEPVTGNQIDHLTELSNWYRVDDAFGVPQSAETLVSSLTKVSQVLTDTNPLFDPRPDTLTVLYRDTPNHANIRIIFNITGGAPGSGFSQLDEDIRIYNTSSTDDLYIHFFEYVDLDLHGTPDDDVLGLTGTGSLGQSDQHTDATGTFEADHYEINYYPNTVNKLLDGNVDNLNDFPGPLGPANVTWALQFDFVGPPPGNPPGFRQRIGPQQFADIHKEGHLQMYYIPVPEPASGFLAAVAATAILMLQRKRSRVC